MAIHNSRDKVKLYLLAVCMKNLLKRYKLVVSHSLLNDLNDNYDGDRFGWPENLTSRNTLQPTRLKSVLKSLPKRSVRKLLEIVAPRFLDNRTATLWVKPYIRELQWIYDNLEDEQSRSLLVSLLAYRALGHRRVRLPLNTPLFWEQRQQSKNLRDLNTTFPSGSDAVLLYKTDLHSIGYPFELFVMGVDCQFMVQQYRYVTEDKIIQVKPDDIVIDAGGCHGDTAFYFAEKCGDGGHVYSFEFLPDNLKVFKKNIEINKGYGDKITIVEHPVWVVSGQKLFVESNGPATRVVESSICHESIIVETLSIDDFNTRNKLSSVDFIKMDIEGSELSALKGAESTIRKFRPTLAISVYHQFSDFWEIPQWINSLQLGYKFYLGHYTIHAEETVLYAQARN